MSSKVHEMKSNTNIEYEDFIGIRKAYSVNRVKI